VAYYANARQPGYWLDEDDAPAIKVAEPYVREPAQLPNPLDRRSRPR
jgi:hypothetical protein